VQKPVQTGLARFWLGFFRFWLGFFGLARFFRFGLVFFCFGSVRFFHFFTYKTEPADFFKILIGFFLFSFLSYFFSNLLDLINFLIFLLTPVSVGYSL